MESFERDSSLIRESKNYLLERESRLPRKEALIQALWNDEAPPPPSFLCRAKEGGFENLNVSFRI